MRRVALGAAFAALLSVVAFSSPSVAADQCPREDAFVSGLGAFHNIAA